MWSQTIVSATADCFDFALLEKIFPGGLSKAADMLEKPLLTSSREAYNLIVSVLKKQEHRGMTVLEKGTWVVPEYLAEPKI